MGVTTHGAGMQGLPLGAAQLRSQFTSQGSTLAFDI